MQYQHLISIVALVGSVFCFQACSSDNELDPVPPINIEDSNTVARRDFCKRYNLPEDKVMALNNLQGVAKDNIAIFSGANDLNQGAVIICDTIANKALYYNFNQIQFDNNVEFYMPYGEKKTLPFNDFYIGEFTVDGDNIASASKALYCGTELMYNHAYLNYRLFYINGKMSVYQLPQLTETLYKKQHVIPWYDGTTIFYFNYDYDNPDLKLVSCYDKSGSSCYEAVYPYFSQDYTSYDLFSTRITQPISISNGIGINHSNGTITAFAGDIEHHSMIWLKKDVAIEGYEYKESDRVSLIKKSFANDVLTFEVEVVRYNGDKNSYQVAVTTDGEVSFPK